MKHLFSKFLVAFLLTSAVVLSWSEYFFTKYLDRTKAKFTQNGIEFPDKDLKETLTFSVESYLFQIPLWQSIFCVVKNWKRWEQQQGLFKIQFFSQNALEKLLNPCFRMKTSDLGNFLKKFVQVHSKRFSGQ